MVSIHRPLGYEPNTLPLRHDAYAVDTVPFQINYALNQKILRWRFLSFFLPLLPAHFLARFHRIECGHRRRRPGY